VKLFLKSSALVAYEYVSELAYLHFKLVSPSSPLVST